MRIRHGKGTAMANIVFCLLPLFWLVGDLAVAAEPLGTSFIYQGRLVESGTPANGQFDFRFELFNAPRAGSSSGPVVGLTGVPVQDGQFRVSLDFGAAFDGTAFWLEVSVRPGGSGGYTILAPRQPIAATPYALYALTPRGEAGPPGPKGDPGPPAALTPALSALNLSNLVVVCEGDSITDWGLDGTQRTWPWFLKNMSWASGRCLLFTNFALAGGRLDGTTNWFVGDPGLWTDGGNTAGCYQRSQRFLPGIAAMYPTAERWVLLRLPINDGFPPDYGTSFTNYCNLVRGYGFKLAVITSSPASNWADMDAIGARNAFVIRCYPAYDKLVDVSSIYRTYDDNVMYGVEDKKHPSRLASQIEASFINAQMLTPCAMPWVQNPSTVVLTTNAPANPDVIVGWETVRTLDGTVYKRPLYR
jgi:hypothetical protein